MTRGQSAYGRVTSAWAAIAFLASLTGADAAYAQADPGAQGARAATAVLYKPRVANAPPARVGGANRGAGSISVRLAVLAPNHTGFTSREQPVLYWYLSQPVKAKVEITLTTESSVEPLLELALAADKMSGVQSIPLAEHGIRLAPDTEYRWHVALVMDAEHRSKDILASGALMRVAADQQLAARLAGMAGEERALLYAENGLWYDALESASSAKTARLSSKLFDNLIEQAGLNIPSR